LESNEVNITGTLNVLLAARDNGVKRVVYAASSAAYGDQPTLPKVETMTPEPMSPYAIGKLAGELYAQSFTRLYGLSTVSLRYFNVFGPRQDPATQYAGVVAKFATCALEKKPFPIDGDGEQSRDFTYVENVVNVNLLAADAKFDGSPVVNIAFGQRTTINQVALILNELTHQNLTLVHGAPRPGDVRHSHADITVARKLLGYDPRIDMHQGLERTLEWYRTK
jgi:nucleoside-diphosphate-sugar epimerase